VEIFTLAGKMHPIGVGSICMKILKKTSLKDYFIKGFIDWRNEFLEYRYLIFLSLIIVVIAALLDYFAGVYVSKRAETADVPDLILDHIGPINIGFLYVYGYLVLCLTLLLYPFFFHIRTLHIVLSQFSFLVMLRSVFTVFTHLQTPQDAIRVSFPWIFKSLSFQNDMFFSGHTAIPFLGFLLFSGNIRYFFLFGSLCMGTVVLLTHTHYSIDVFSAFFIAYCCHRFGNTLLMKTEPYIKRQLSS
jgi:hypothetical protein